MTLDQIDAAVDNLGDHFLVPIVKGLTANVRALERRVAELERHETIEHDYAQEQLERSESVEAYDVGGTDRSTTGSRTDVG